MKTITENEWHALSNKERNLFTGIVKWNNGSVSYFENGNLHRLDGPAVTNTQGYKSWHFKGKRHNLNCPARIYSDGYAEYWIYGKPTTKVAVDFLRDICKLKNIEL
jgi:hypothetical protein